MRVTLTNTTRVVELETAAGATMPARIWEGTTDKGVPVLAFVTRIAAELGHDLEEFERDLAEQTPPTNPDVDRWPARMALDGLPDDDRERLQARLDTANSRVEELISQRDHARRVIERVLERHKRLATLSPADAAELVGAATLWQPVVGRTR